MKKVNILIILIFLGACAEKKSNVFLFDEDGFTQIKISINGLKKTFIFDTCAEATIISQELAKELNLIPHRSITINNLNKTEIVYIPQIDINGIKLNNVEAAVLDMTTSTFSCPNVSGIIGLNLINLFVWDFNLKTNSFIVHNKSSYKGNDFIAIEYHKIEPTGLPFIKIKTTNAESDSVFFDTGFTGFLSLNNLKDTTDLDFERIVTSKKDIFGIKETKYTIYSARDFELFGKKFDKVPLRLNLDIENKELIGNMFIREFNRFIFDPFNSKILLSTELER